MVVLFLRLFEFDQCDIFVEVLIIIQCIVLDIIELLFSLIEMKQNINVSCFGRGRIKFNLCSQVNRIFVGEIFCSELLNVFELFFLFFKCYIINVIVLVYSVKGR